MNVEYNCKFCGTAGVADCADDCPPLQLDVWKSWLCCDRCAQFERARRDAEESVIKTCWALVTARDCTTGSLLLKTQDRIKAVLTSQTQEFFRIVGNRYRGAQEWLPDFVDLLMDEPKKAQTYLQVHFNRAKKASERPKQYRQMESVA